MNNTSIFLRGKNLKELNFSSGWIYEPDMRRWKSENYFITCRELLSFRDTGRHEGEPVKKYLYITDQMLYELKFKDTI